MQIIKIDINKYNRLSIGTNNYFVIKKDNAIQLLSTKCPHRGGPLQYSSFSDCKTYIICPWHKNKLKPCLLNKAMPASVYVSGILTVLFEDDNKLNMWHENNIADGELS